MRKNGYVNNSQSTIQHIGIQAQPHPDKCVQLATSLDYIQKWQARRQEVAFTLREAFENIGLGLRQSPKYSHTNYHKFCIFVNNKTVLRDKMLDNGVECQLHYTYNFSQVPILSKQLDSNFIFTEKFKQHAISLPSSPWLTDTEAETVVQTLKKCIADADKGVTIDG